MTLKTKTYLTAGLADVSFFALLTAKYYNNELVSWVDVVSPLVVGALVIALLVGRERKNA